MNIVVVIYSTKGKTKKDFSTAILERKKAPNRLVVDDSVNDDNSTVSLNIKTMEELQLYTCSRSCGSYGRVLEDQVQL